MPSYVYPFRSIRRKRKDYWIDSKFNLQHTVNHLDGRVIEFAGPSINGYYFLKRITLPLSVEITNIDADGGFFSKENKKLAKQHISQLLDIIHMELADESVGVALLSCLCIAPDYMMRGDVGVDGVVSAIHKEIDTLVADPEKVPVYSLRARFLRKASKFLKADGLIIVEQLSKQEIRYAEAIGFRLRAYNGIDHDTDGSYYQSLVLQKTR